MRCYAFPYIYRDIRLESVVSNPCIQRPRISPCYGIVRSGGTLPGLIPGGIYEAGTVPHTSTVLYCTVLAPAPATLAALQRLFILVMSKVRVRVQRQHLYNELSPPPPPPLNIVDMFIIQVICSLYRFIPQIFQEKVESWVKRTNFRHKKWNLLIARLADPKRFSGLNGSQTVPVHL